MKKLIYLLAASISVIFISAALPNNDGGYAIGDKAENFSLKNIDGEIVSLSDYEDAKGFVIIFTCNTCPYAKLYEDRIIDMHNEMEAKGFHVIAINPNDPSIKPGDSYGKMQTRAREKDFNFPYLFDENQEVFPKFGAKSTPHAFVLDQDLTVRYIGAIDDSPRDSEGVKDYYVMDAVTAIVEGKEPAVTYTKAIGCGIKSKKYNKLKGIKKNKQAKKYSKAKGMQKAKS